ncbi:MAG: hypothetical protein WCT99_03565 [Bacteroidota bacterium]|jgi:hypothetical protein
MNWLTQIENERRRIQPGENPGRTRTIARRIAGIALKQIYDASVDDFMLLLQRASNDLSLPPDVQHAAARLSTRLSPDFQSPSVDPVGDADIIVTYAKTLQ